MYQRRILVKSRREPSKISVNGRVNSEWIPVDLVVTEILSRLPAKSIARCRCVSKLWASILCPLDFAELFLTRSQARQQLLFICHKQERGELFFFSSPQPQYSDGVSSLATVSYLMKIPFYSYYRPIWHIHGLAILRDDQILEGRQTLENVSIICNPSTGQSLVLPKMKSRECLFSYFGYDPIEKQFKVLSLTRTHIGANNIVSPLAFLVLTLGTKKMSWRKLECCTPHHPICKMICINGVLYYGAYNSLEGPMIVSFGIRSEKFCFMKVSEHITQRGATLINYNGKLGSLVSDGLRSFVLWILEDTETHDWSYHIHVLPPFWKDVVVVGMVGGNEILFSPHTYSLPFYVIYYNIERNTIRRVEIQGLEGSKGNRVCTFLNHVEDIKPIDGY